MEDMGSIRDMDDSSARADYIRHLKDAESQLAQLKLNNQKLTWLRTVLFFVAGAALLFGYGGENYQLLLITIGWLAAIGFVVAIVWHEHVRGRVLRHEADRDLFNFLIARLDRDWDNVPASGVLTSEANMPFADDLDVAGPASLLSFLALAGTRPGRLVLEDWLANTRNWEQIKARQEAAQKLTSLRDLRISILKTVRDHSDGTEDVHGLPRWASQPCWLSQHRGAHILSYLGPALVLLGIVTIFAGVSGGQKTWVNTGAIVLAMGFINNIVVTIFWGGWLHGIFQQITGEHSSVHRFADVFASFESLPSDDGGLLDGIRAAAIEGDNSALKGFSELLWKVRLANLQRDPIMYVVYLALQLTVLWDFRVMKLLEGWQVRYRDHVSGWFESLGVCEALVSTSTLADEYPSWAYPTPLTDAGDLIRAENLGHPLLPDAARVGNDFSLQKDRPLLLITGSNMAGKSTFMRSLGLNLLLTRVGAPVCASKLETDVYDMATSIRVRDSLRDGVSFFMAELNRLKEVVDTAEHRQAQGHPLLFLLDEILQGTNSKERQIAVSTVVQRLLNLGAVGCVSTHDLDLATAEEIESVSQVVHFREFFEQVDGKEQMRFDYRLRDGQTPTTNALKLLRMVGLSE